MYSSPNYTHHSTDNCTAASHFVCAVHWRSLVFTIEKIPISSSAGVVVYPPICPICFGKPVGEWGRKEKYSHIFPYITRL